MKASFGVVGVGGYASSHIHAAETLEEEGLGQLSAVVVRRPEKYREAVDRLEAKNVTIYPSYEEMLESENGRVNTVALPTAIHQHRDMTVRALDAGYNVIVEKPPAVTIQDLDEMIRAEERSGKFCAVGFQSQSASVVKALKDLISEGRLGKILAVVVKGIWKRRDSYYERNAWAGQFIYDGKYVLDGTICNPLSHYLMNGLYFASTKKRQASIPVKVRAELYRGHRIEGEDTSCLEIEVDNGAKIFFFGTLCGPSDESPSHKIIGSRARAEWTVGQDASVEYQDGESEVVRNDGSNERVNVFRNAAKYLLGTEAELNCTLSTTRPFVLALNGAYESARTIRDIPDRHLRVEREGDSTSTAITDIVDIVNEAFQKARLYSNLGVKWARPTEYFALKDYKAFNVRL